MDLRKIEKALLAGNHCAPSQIIQAQAYTTMNSKSIFIKNISAKTTPADLREIFGMFGGVQDVYIPAAFDTKKSMGRAFIQFTSPEEAAIASITSSGLILDGRVIEVEICRGDRKSSDHMRTKPAPRVAL